MSLRELLPFFILGFGFQAALNLGDTCRFWVCSHAMLATNPKNLNLVIAGIAYLGTFLVIMILTLGLTGLTGSWGNAASFNPLAGFAALITGALAANLAGRLLGHLHRRSSVTEGPFES
jgi:hypothetical protein